MKQSWLQSLKNWTPSLLYVLFYTTDLLSSPCLVVRLSLKLTAVILLLKSDRCGKTKQKCVIEKCYWKVIDVVKQNKNASNFVRHTNISIAQFNINSQI